MKDAIQVKVSIDSDCDTIHVIKRVLTDESNTEALAALLKGALEKQRAMLTAERVEVEIELSFGYVSVYRTTFVAGT